MFPKHLMFTTALFLVFLQVPEVDCAESVHLDLKPITQTVIAGIPVVVKLQYTNRSAMRVEVYPLIDFYLGFVVWRWDSNEAPSYEVPIRDFYSAIPGINPPKTITMEPSEKRAWYFTVPTPVRFGTEVHWTLTATVKNLDNRQETQRATTTLVGRDPKIRAVSEAIGPARAQGAVLDVYSEGEVRLLAKRNKMGLVEECSRKGDRAADLILFSKALADKNGVARHWKSLEDAPDEIKCLRNYLLFVPLERYSDVITEGEAEALRTSLAQKKSPLGAELLERIERRQR